MELLTKAISFTMSSLSTWLGSRDLLKDVGKLFDKDHN